MRLWLLDLFRPLRATDPDFGAMRFLRQTSTWECQAPCHDAETLEVLVFGEATGPTVGQRGKLREFLRDRERLLAEARPALAAAVQQSSVDDFQPLLAAITIPTDSEHEYDIELTFGDRSGPPQFDIRLLGGAVQAVIGPV